MVGLAVGAANGRLGAFVLAVVFAVVLLLLTVRMTQLGVHVSNTGIKVVNYVRSAEISWADVAGFDVRQYGQWRYVGHVLRHSSGRAVPILAMAGTGAIRGQSERGRERVQKPIDELNRLLERQRHAS
jgi:hypothetical protein